MTRRQKLCAIVLVLCLVAAEPAAAYEQPLSSHSVREGYFLGRRSDDKPIAFLAKYVQRLPLPKTGPHVAEIEVRTPYAQVVQRARQALPGYSAMQAQKDYDAQPDLILVRVRINLTPTYPAQVPGPSGPKGGFRLRPDDFWRDFSIRFVQEQPISPKSVRGEPVYRRGRSVVGAEIVWAFDATQVASAPTRIEVLTPDGQTVVAEFDLRDLR